MYSNGLLTNKYIYIYIYRLQCAYTFSKSTKEVFGVQRSMALSKHAIKYGTQSGFPYCNLTIPPPLPSHQKVPPIRYLGMR